MCGSTVLQTTLLELLRHEKARESEASKSRNCPLLNFSIRHRKKERRKKDRKKERKVRTRIDLL